MAKQRVLTPPLEVRFLLPVLARHGGNNENHITERKGNRMITVANVIKKKQKRVLKMIRKITTNLIFISFCLFLMAAESIVDYLIVNLGL